MSELEIQEVADAIKSGWITTGPKTKELERQIAQYVGVNRCVCLNSQTACGEMALRILGIGAGDEVIVPAYTYSASASIVDHVGAKIVFVDVQEGCLEMDYDKMDEGMAAMKKLMESTDQVHITGPNTDLRFSIKGMRAIPCGGQYNIPDGEIFTAPVRDSVEGVVEYNAPTIYNGVSFDRITLEFEKGKIVRAGSPSNELMLRKILSSDEGAAYIGEFAMGFNPYVNRPMRDILFDEKIAGSFHFTPGQAYTEADNGNKSRIHWDMVCIQTPEYGGGEIRFDGKLVRKDGVFIGEGIEKLNPEYLK